MLPTSTQHHVTFAYLQQITIILIAHFYNLTKLHQKYYSSAVNFISAIFSLIDVVLLQFNSSKLINSNNRKHLRMMHLQPDLLPLTPYLVNLPIICSSNQVKPALHIFMYAHTHILDVLYNII